MAPLGPLQALGRDDAGHHHAVGDGQPPGQHVGHSGGPAAPVEVDDRDHRRLGGARTASRPSRGPEPFRDLGEHHPGRDRVRGEQLLERGAGHLDHGRVAACTDRRGPRLAGEQGQLAQDLSRAELADGPAPDLHLEATAPHDVRRPGRVALADQPGAGGDGGRAGGRLEPVPCVLGQPGQQRHVGEVARIGARECRSRQRRVPAAGARTPGERRPRTPQRPACAAARGAGRPRPRARTRDRQDPAVVERRDRRRGGRITEDDDQEGDPQHPAQLPGAGHDRGRGRVAPPGHRGQRRAAQQRQGRADPDAAEHLAGKPLGPERGHQSDFLVVPEVGARPHEGAGDHEESVAVLVGQGAEPRRHHRGDESARHQGEAGPQHVVAPDVLQPQDVVQQIGVEPDARQHGCDRGDAEGGDP